MIDVNQYDALAIPGGFKEYGFYKEAYHEKTLNLICAFHSQHKPIASVCVAAFPLAKSGILKNRKATTYHLLKMLTSQEKASEVKKVMGY